MAARIAPQSMLAGRAWPLRKSLIQSDFFQRPASSK
jgi:hypothetical protein